MRLFDGAQDNVIGPDNIIAYNGDAGVAVMGENTLRNTVTDNSIFSNGGVVLDYSEQADQGLPVVTITPRCQPQRGGDQLPGAAVEVFFRSGGRSALFRRQHRSRREREFLFHAAKRHFPGQDGHRTGDRSGREHLPVE